MAVRRHWSFRRQGQPCGRTRRPERSGRPRWSTATRESTLGPVTEQTGAEVRATAADAARQARGVLAALADPDDELTTTAAMRHRIEGAALALETLASQPDAPGKRLPGR